MNAEMVALVGIHTILTVLNGSSSPTPVQENTKNILYEDAAILLIHDPGGSETFSYVAGVLNINSKFQGTNAVLLGDRITQRDLQIRNGVLITKYADRRPGKPMTATP